MLLCLSTRGRHQYTSATARLASYSDSNCFFIVMTFITFSSQATSSPTALSPPRFGEWQVFYKIFEARDHPCGISFESYRATETCVQKNLDLCRPVVSATKTEKYL